MKHKLTTLLLCGVLSLSSCSVFAGEAMDLTAEDSVQIAMENNKTIRQYRADYKSAVSKKHQARRSMGPTLNWGSKALRLGGTYYNSNKVHDDYINTLTLSMPIYTGGQLEGTIKAADLGLNASELALELAKQNVRYKTKAAYYKTLQSKNQIRVAQDTVDALSEHMKNVNYQFAAGTVARKDVLASQVQLANANQSLIDANNNYGIAIEGLKKAMGVVTDDKINIKDELTYTPYEIPFSECQSYANENRPDILIAKYKLEIAKAQAQVARAGYLPTVSMAAVKNWSGENAFSGGDEDKRYEKDNNWTAGFMVNWNIWDNNITRAKVDAAEADVEKATASLEDTKENSVVEVKTAYLNLKSAEESIATTEIAVERAKEDFRIAKFSYASGVGTNLDVMDAQEKLTQAETNYYNAMYKYNSSKADLDRAMGIMVDLDIHKYALDK